MGFLAKIFSATVKVAITPLAIVKDVTNVLIGKPVNATKELLESAGDDLKDAYDDVGNGEAL